MKSWLRFAATLACGLMVHGAGAADAAGTFTATDLNSLARISDPQVSPNGRYLVYVQRETDFDANRGRNDLWLVDLNVTAPKPRRLTQNSANDTHPRWSVDGTNIYFLSSRTGSTQIWRLPMSGGEAVQITDYPLDVGTFKFSSGGGRIALGMDVFPDCADLKCTRARLDAAAANKVVGAQLRQPVRAALGYLERPHALQPVRGAGERRRPRRHAGQRQPRARGGRSFQALSAATRNSRSPPTARAWCSARASRAARSRGRRTSISTKCRRTAARRRRTSRRTIRPGTRSRCS